MVYFLYNSKACGSRAVLCVPRAKKQFPSQESKAMDLIGLNTAAFLNTLTPQDSVVLCGGDGTINRFANHTYNLSLPCPVYLYPAGTGNDFLRDISPKKKVLPARIDEYIHSLPVATVNDSRRRFLNNASFGIDGAVCEVADRQRERGKKHVSFASIALSLLLHGYHPTNATVTVDGVKKSYRHVWMAPAMNGRFIGGGMMAAPQQDRTSGLLTSVVVYGVGRLKALFRFPAIFSGKHIAFKNMVDCRTGKHIRVDFETPCALQIDGETILGVRSFCADIE